ncbi:hypothetical protein [Escherichia coli]|uniref:hypothetical protein n=1 Tax=Escherichia coli TaxID=562 RepID=UPI00208F232A|nr:hypothetical protein [Escherichia coli]
MFGIDAQRIAAFAKSPLDNPLSRSEQMELARLFLHIQKQADIFNNMPNQPILDGHIQMVINSHCHERCNSDPHPTPEIRSRG